MSCDVNPTSVISSSDVDPLLIMMSDARRLADTNTMTFTTMTLSCYYSYHKWQSTNRPGMMATIIDQM